jgi:small subunit ribosomal protein S4e
MSKHLKRLASPRKWPIPRKTSVWVTKPDPGPHSIEKGIPLLIGIRDFLKQANTAAEARRIIGSGNVLVDGKISRQYKRPLGLMDVISIPGVKEYYRVLLDSKGKLRFIKISKDEAKWKLVRIENKTTVKGGKTQLNLHDGRNVLLTKDKYKTGDVLKISLPEQKILAHYAFEPGNMVMLIGGKHIGEFATITKYEEIKSSKPNIVYFERFSTIEYHVFMVGHDKPEITVAGLSVLEDITSPTKETDAKPDNEKKSSIKTKEVAIKVEEKA